MAEPLSGFRMILNCLFPVFAMVLMGYVLKRSRLTNETFLNTSDRLVYFIFFPLMLFWKIGGASNAGIDWGLCKAAILTFLVVYVLSLVGIKLLGVSAFKAGTFSQTCYRFNTYVGMAVILNAAGEAGVRHFGVLIGFIIPLFNLSAVSTLIWFSGKRYSLRERGLLTAKAVVSNPLILACMAGILYARYVNHFPDYLENAFRLASFVTLPLALLSIGGALTWKKLGGNFNLSLAASAVKLAILPLAGYFCLRLFNVQDIPFKVGMIFFALPTSTAIYVLSSQLNSDTDLASAAIVLSTVLSFFSLSVALVI